MTPELRYRIEQFLTASGVCSQCGGEGSTPVGSGTGSSYRAVECRGCRGTGQDRYALLRAVQAVGLLLMDQAQPPAAAPAPAPAPAPTPTPTRSDPGSGT